MANQRDGQGKIPIYGQSRPLTDEEAEGITQMIQDAQQSSRLQYIPAEDLSPEATTQMAPEVARVIDESKVHIILEKFNRDYLYGMGRFDEYDRGLLLKWGDGYSRKHIWVTVEGDNLIFETSHECKCAKDYCTGGHHVFTPQMWHNTQLINEELADQFRRPIQERSDD
ncbi:MAG TPA: hypothetical protein VF120_14100 [Ktedonobacterales bacterium]